MRKILTVLFIILCSKVLAQTEYSRIPKFINKQIQKEYSSYNIFYFYFEKSDGYVIWKYENSKVYWKFFNKNTLVNSGDFESILNSSVLSKNDTNKTLQNDLIIFEEKIDCKNVLDGAFFGYIYSIDNKEFIGTNTINVPECYENNNSIIAKDFEKIFNLNYKIEN